MWAAVVWVEPYDESANIESVMYYLHPTFQPSVVTRYQSENFWLDFNTWGSFEIQAVVTFNDGSQQTLTQYLEQAP